MKEIELTPKRAAYAAALATGISQAEAYRRAFPASRKWKDATVHQEASRLAGDPKVRARVAQLQQQGARAAVFTLADHLQNLGKISAAALRAKDFGAAARAEESRGKASGFYPTKVELTGRDGGPIESKQTRDLTDEELAAELGRHGIKP